jgi:hypothetical protein
MLGVVCLALSVRAEEPRPAIHLPPGCDFDAAIHAEGQSTADLVRSYRAAITNGTSTSAYGLALANLAWGLVSDDASGIVSAHELFATAHTQSSDPAVRGMAERAMEYTDTILSGNFRTGPVVTDAVDRIVIGPRTPAPASFRMIVIGRSAIRVPRHARIKTQADRVTRDWLTGYNAAQPPWTFSASNAVPWHEGKKLQELVRLTDATVIPVWGTAVRRYGQAWFAPDAEGIYRFELAEDKVLNCPTAIVGDDGHAILNDTHGISAIAWNALDADLALGCGDHPGKVEAAYYLAQRGVNVYMPTDRFLSLLMGVPTRAGIIGSAPVKPAAEGAVIGDQPLAIDVNEPIVVSTAANVYPLRYYDTAQRYFKALADYSGRSMTIATVEVTRYGHGAGVVDEARKRGARVIGTRVISQAEHDAVAAWLREDASHRIVLFHTAVYPAGYSLFFEFPQQTTFGDIHPQFE